MNGSQSGWLAPLHNLFIGLDELFKVKLQQIDLPLEAISHVFRAGDHLRSHFVGDDLERVIHNREAVGVLIAARKIRFGTLVCEPHGDSLLVEPRKDAPPIMVNSVSGLQILEIKCLKEDSKVLEGMGFILSNSIEDLELFNQINAHAHGHELSIEPHSLNLMMGTAAHLKGLLRIFLYFSCISKKNLMELRVLSLNHSSVTILCFQRGYESLLASTVTSSNSSAFSSSRGQYSS